MTVALRAVVSTLLLAAGFADRAETCVPDATPDWMVSALLSDVFAPSVRPADVWTVQEGERTIKIAADGGVSVETSRGRKAPSADQPDRRRGCRTAESG
jgi:hypothetical protein